MCGRYADRRHAAELEDYYRAAVVADSLRKRAPSWNIKPTTPVPLLLESVDDQGEVTRRLEQARWSLTPMWSKTLGTKFTTFNARIETAHEKPMYRHAVAHARAILPAEGYYEWVGEGKNKRPHYIHLPDDEPLSLAGLYSWWRDPEAPEGAEDRWHLTCTMLTSDAVETIADVHDREPVPLPPEWWGRWLDPAVEGTAELLHEVGEASLDVAGRLVHHEVAPLRGDGPDLTRAL